MSEEELYGDFMVEWYFNQGRSACSWYMLTEHCTWQVQCVTFATGSDCKSDFTGSGRETLPHSLLLRACNLCINHVNDTVHCVCKEPNVQTAHWPGVTTYMYMYLGL